MNDIEYNGVHHVDGTYRITKNGFPLQVYCISDQAGQFHAICSLVMRIQNISFYFIEA